MRPNRKRTSAAYMSRPAKPQPRYHDVVSDEYVGALKRRIDAEKPVNFALTPITEPGW